MKITKWSPNVRNYHNRRIDTCCGALFNHRLQNLYFILMSDNKFGLCKGLHMITSDNTQKFLYKISQTFQQLCMVGIN